MEIETFSEEDEEEVIALWARCELLRPWNDPRRDIARKLLIQRELFLVGKIDRKVIATVMAGYDGHRGWVNYLAVDSGFRRQGIGRTLMEEAERRLVAMGCPKVNLQIRNENEDAMAFYERLGFERDAVVSMGKRIQDVDSC
jgi:ribosomal protein S18 acetylase RimI-like enzyme